MSLSLTMIASSSVGDRSWRFADSLTASAIFRHCDGVQAGVCQRIRSFTEQIVCARQLSATTFGTVPGGGRRRRGGDRGRIGRRRSVGSRRVRGCSEPAAEQSSGGKRQR